MHSLNPSPNPDLPLRTAALLLAAGSASRMGGLPKCLLQWDGRSLIERQIQALQACGISEIVVVLGHYAPTIEPVLRDGPARIVHNPQPQAGQASSLRWGLAALEPAQPNGFDTYYIGLADQPLIDAPEINDLLTAHAQRPAGRSFTQPLVNGLPGNPVVFTAQVRQELLQATGESGGRQWQQAHPDQVYRWPTDNPNYRIDLDSPEDLQAFTLRTGRALRWPASVQS